MTNENIRWSGPAIMADDDAKDYGVQPGSVVVWAGHSDGSGHVDETAVEILEAHDATGERGEFAADWGSITEAWIRRALASMSEELGLPANYLH